MDRDKLANVDGAVQVFQTYEDGDSYCQGDVIRICNRDGRSSTYGVIITADCDLVQQKHSGTLSYLETIPVEPYIAGIWAPIEVTRLRSHLLKQVLRDVRDNAVLRASADNELSIDDLADWVGTSGANRICELLQLNPKKDSGTIKNLACLESLLKPGELDSYRLLLRAWRILETKQTTIVNSYKVAIDPVRGPSDIFFLPYMPDARDVGFIIRLRSILSFPENLGHKSELDWKISGRSGAFYRVGRLCDNLRFSVVQRMASLFSRIGHDTFFESEVASASDIVAEDLVRKSEERYNEL